ncbi:MAG: hypothetical protein ARM1_0580 [Candidatus Micrarchaeota archaeon]|nr:MAG: hypothetical protein ARM1_0580 [Candidatus Micrarchaeota archaeon]
MKFLLMDYEGCLFPIIEKHPKIGIIYKEAKRRFISEVSGVEKDNVSDLLKRLRIKYKTDATPYILNREYKVEIDSYIENVYKPVLSIAKKLVKKDDKLKERLEEIDYDKAVLSNTPRYIIEHLAKLQGIRDQLSFIMGLEDIMPTPKPYKDAYKKAYEEIKKSLNRRINKKDVIYFEDNVENIRSAGRFGFTTVLIGDTRSKCGDFRFKDIYKALSYFFED